MSIRNQGRSTSGWEVGEAVAANGPDQLDLICIQPIFILMYVLRIWENVMCPYPLHVVGYLRSAFRKILVRIVENMHAEAVYDIHIYPISPFQLPLR